MKEKKLHIEFCHMVLILHWWIIKFIIFFFLFFVHRRSFRTNHLHNPSNMTNLFHTLTHMFHSNDATAYIFRIVIGKYEYESRVATVDIKWLTNYGHIEQRALSTCSMSIHIIVFSFYSFVRSFVRWVYDSKSKFRYTHETEIIKYIQFTHICDIWDMRPSKLKFKRVKSLFYLMRSK